MASSSLATRENDVYLCFRGEDVRNNFINHLDKALRRKKIQTFIDNTLDPGGCIPRSIVHAIEESKISVIVFSEKHVASLWFLEELEKILECKKQFGQIVIPVYYQVDPSDVRNRTGNFGRRFAIFEEQLKESPQTLRRYKSALEEAVNIYGFDWQVIRPEPELVEKIVEDIMKRLQDMSPKYDQGSRFLSVFFLVLEAIAVVLDLYGKSKKSFLLAAFLLSAFGFIITIYAFIRKRTTAAFKQKAAKELAWVEVVFSVFQLVTLFIQNILAVARVKNSYNLSFFPLVFALLLVVFAFKKEKTVNRRDQITYSQLDDDPWV